jgi:hypothetical protein
VLYHHLTHPWVLLHEQDSPPPSRAVVPEDPIHSVQPVQQAGQVGHRPQNLLPALRNSLPIRLPLLLSAAHQEPRLQILQVSLVSRPALDPSSVLILSMQQRLAKSYALL